jgi:hypothetical protein
VPRTLSEPGLRAALLARQHLLTPSRAPIPQMLQRIGFLQTQHAPSAYVALWSRSDGMVRDDLTRELERGRVIQATTLRVTIHMCAQGDYWPTIDAVTDARRAWWLAATKGAVTDRQMRRHAERMRAALADGPRSRTQLIAELGLEPQVWNGVGLWVDLVRVPPSGTWERRRADLYGLAEQHVGPRPPVDVEAGRDLLVRRYLQGFPPATPKDIATWAGLAPADLGGAIDRVATRRFIDERGRELVDLPRAPLPDPGSVPIRFIPTWDAILLVHARATQVLREEHRPLIFNTKTPQSVGTVLIDGQVGATWRQRDGRIVVEPFDELPRRTARALADETARLEAFVA